MDFKECYRVLELEIGASHEAVDSAFCRLIERWHPDRAASGGPEAVREAQRMVQAINDAHHTLAQAVPKSARPPAPLRTTAAPAAGAKPMLSPLPAGQPVSGRPPPRPPPMNPLPPPPASTTTRPAASAPPPAPTPDPAAAARKSRTAPPTPVSDPRRKVAAFYETLFPLGSPRRRFGPLILAGALVFVLLLGKCAFSSSGSKRDQAPDPRTTGSLVVKSNLANTMIEATRIPPPGGVAATRVRGTVDQALSGLPPGKYVVTTRSEGWPEMREEVNLEAGLTTEVAINFKSGSLRLDSVPAGATVRLGESVLGQTPLVIPQLPPGECLLSLEYPSWPVVSFKTTIIENVESTGSVRLPHGKLTVATTPPGATVLLGGKVIGQTPLTLERVPAGAKKLILQAKDFPTLEVAGTVQDGGQMNVNVALGSVFPVLDPDALLRAVWVPDNRDKLAPGFDSSTGPHQPQNGVIRNLHRKRLSENWLRKSYRFSAIIKSYDRNSGQIEFAEQKNELTRYRILAKLSPGARDDGDLAAQLTKGASFTLYGRLTAAEEPRWPFKVITLEISAAEPLR
jgi:PEGA domain/DnaJ domain